MMMMTSPLTLCILFNEPPPQLPHFHIADPPQSPLLVPRLPPRPPVSSTSFPELPRTQSMYLCKSCKSPCPPWPCDQSQCMPRCRSSWSAAGIKLTICSRYCRRPQRVLLLLVHLYKSHRVEVLSNVCPEQPQPCVAARCSSRSFQFCCPCRALRHLRLWKHSLCRCAWHHKGSVQLLHWTAVPGYSRLRQHYPEHCSCLRWECCQLGFSRLVLPWDNLPDHYYL